MKNRTIVNLSTLSVWRRVADPPSSRGKAGKDLSSTEIPVSEIPTVKLSNKELGTLQKLIGHV